MGVIRQEIGVQFQKDYRTKFFDRFPGAAQNGTFVSFNINFYCIALRQSERIQLRHLHGHLSAWRYPSIRPRFKSDCSVEVTSGDRLDRDISFESVVANGFPTLTRAQVYECLAYYEDHRGEIDVLVSRQMQTEA